ncbi:MAG: aminoacetone oxidase family FAD-binding enzyme [Firmicutes bacterium]|nr:aminoacetone oxidase family FAD-binding enzyme [Bacillota bacterium]
MRIAIVGAGASGLTCACLLSSQHNVTIFDKNPVSGKKLLMTGNTRCNITNDVDLNTFLQSVPQNSKFLSACVHKFAPSDTVKFLNQLGIQARMENNNRVFPTFGGATAVRDALENHARSKGVNFIFNTTITNITKSQDSFVLEYSDKHDPFDTIIIATGGMSFPQIGSTGDGYKFARTLGHTILQPRPALCGLKIDHQCAPGITIPCEVQILEGTTPVINKQLGNILFTKHGVSGPVIFNATSNFKSQTIRNCFLQVNFTPHLTNTEFDSLLSKAINQNARKKPFYIFRNFVPISVANWLVELANFSKGKTCADLTKSERIRLSAILTSAQIPIQDFSDLETATITRGGVDTNEIDSHTMQSKLVKKLFFIGEVLDIDALSGGFNLQIAFSTAATCANHLNSI